MFPLSCITVDLSVSHETGSDPCRHGDQFLGTLSPQTLHHLCFLTPNGHVIHTELPVVGFVHTEESSVSLRLSHIYFFLNLSVFLTHTRTYSMYPFVPGKTRYRSRQSPHAQKQWHSLKEGDKASDRNQSVCRFVNIKTGKQFLVNSSHAHTNDTEKQSEHLVNKDVSVPTHTHTYTQSHTDSPSKLKNTHS